MENEELVKLLRLRTSWVPAVVIKKAAAIIETREADWRTDNT
jgi:hypothetical protein